MAVPRSVDRCPPFMDRFEAQGIPSLPCFSHPPVGTEGSRCGTRSNCKVQPFFACFEKSTAFFAVSLSWVPNHRAIGFSEDQFLGSTIGAPIGSDYNDLTVRPHHKWWLVEVPKKVHFMFENDTTFSMAGSKLRNNWCVFLRNHHYPKMVSHFRHSTIQLWEYWF